MLWLIPAVLLTLFIWGIIHAAKARDHSPKALDENAAENLSDDPWLSACARRAISSVHSEAE